MADFYADFVYAKVATTTTNSNTNIVVDDTTLFPSNTILAKSDYWLVLESALTYPHTFEIVKLSSVNTGTNTLTVIRAQSGTTGSIHTSGTYVKGALTSDMLRRVRSGFTGTSIPATDSDLYVVGDKFLKTDTGVEYVYDGTNFVVPPPTVRVTATATTASLAPQASTSATTITLSKGYILLSIATSRPARVELYETAAAMTADAGRTVSSDPASGTGVVLDYVTVAGGTTYPLGPIVLGASMESVPTSAISMKVTNLDTSTGTVVVTLVWMKVE